MDLYSVLLARMGGGGGSDIPETTALLKGDGSGGAVAAISGTDYIPPNTTGDLDMSASGEFNFLAGGDINFETEHGFSFKYNGSEIAKKTDIPTFRTDPNDAVYKIDNRFIAATYDADGNEISARYALKRRVVTTVSGSYLTLADNTEYDLTNIEVLNISYPAGKFECYMKLALSTGSSIAISFPAGTTYIGTVPQFGTGETWEISIKDGVVIAGKAVAS